MEKNIITQFQNRTQFERMIKGEHPGILVQFHAPWCGPCRQISGIMTDFMSRNSERMVCCRLNVDDNTDLCACLKGKRLMNGIPCLYYYSADNHSIAPTETITGGGLAKVSAFLASIESRFL